LAYRLWYSLESTERHEMKLTNITIEESLLKKPGRHTDDSCKGLHLWVKNNYKSSWVLRYTLFGKRRNMGLGPYPEISLKEARQRAIQARNSINKGVDPIEAKKCAKTKQEAIVRFDEFAFDYIERKSSEWRNAKHRDQWASTIKTYASPVIGDMDIKQIDTNHLLSILQPIWLNKPETASRLRGRLERVFSAAITLNLRPAMNPAMWRGHLENILAYQRPSEKHHEAVSFYELPQFIEALREKDAVSALALEFTILTACRTGEVLGGTREEIDGDIWLIPANRMKANREHQVPLSPRAIEVLTIAESLDPESKYLFSRNGKKLCNMSMLQMVRRLKPGKTVHGFRSCFRDWVSELTEHRPEVAEMALAHTIQNKVERAYRRGNLLDRRRTLMRDWASYCNGPATTNVIPFQSEQSTNIQKSIKISGRNANGY
jgi:integrase